MLFACGSVDASLRHDEQPRNDHHRATDQQRFVPAALVGEQCRCDGAHEMDRTAVTDVDCQAVLIETPDKANAVFYASQQYTMNDENADYPEMVLGNFVLGGGSLSSRLGTRVRQQEGLSYGIGSSLSASAKDERTEFSVFAITNPENKDRLTSVIRQEIQNFSENGMTADELRRAKEGYLQQQAVARTDDRRVAGLLVATLFNDRTMQFYVDQEREIAEATLEEVNSVIGKYINDEKLVISFAGDFAAAEAAAAK